MNSTTRVFRLRLVHASALFGMAMGMLAAAQVAAQTSPEHDEITSASSSNDAKFGALLGAGGRWQSRTADTPAGPDSFGYGGGVRLGCSGLDFNGYLRAYDPREIIGEMRSTLLSGAQAAAGNYLITLSYASPTIASVLDMMDKKYTARFSAFAQSCDSQSARAHIENRGVAKLAAAGEECFDQAVSRGEGASEAYRRCFIEHRFDGLDVPAASGMIDFLRNHTHVNLTGQVEALLKLLPDERIQDGALQMQPPRTTVAQMSDRLRSQARLALEKLDTGTQPGAIPDCGPDVLLGTSGSTVGCLPADSRPLVTSSAFRSSQMLGDAARAIFNDALSAQMAVGSMYGSLLELYQQTARIDVGTGASGDAALALDRRKRLREAIGDLLAETDAQVKAQTARAQLVKMQMLALDAVEADMNGRAQRNELGQRRPQFGVRGLLDFLAGRN